MRGSCTAENLVTHQEEMLLLAALSRGAQERKQAGFTQSEAEAVWTWAQKTRYYNAMLELTLVGLMNIAVREDGDLVFKAVDDPEIANALPKQKNSHS